ncbi:hypothetical protein JOC85_002705 [Bacillus mesophilus]|nr:hypothetical protein [Bacillus mesophilus]
MFFALLIEVEGRETPAGERVTGDPTGALSAEEAHGLARGKRVSCNENQQQGLTAITKKQKKNATRAFIS